MSRPVFVIPFLAFALQVSQAQLSGHGAPASVVSPTGNGVQHGAPASVLSPTPLPPGVHAPLRTGVRVSGPARRFGSHQHRSQPQVFVPVPLFYPIYSDGAYPSTADPYVPDTSASADTAQTNSAPPSQSSANQASANPSSANQSDDELRAAYLQGARDAMAYQQGDPRYGQHYTDSRENSRHSAEKPKQQAASANGEFSMIPVEDKTPSTVFIFKDGHQMETKNYAIMGGTLFDFSGTTLKKIKLDDLDSTATVKANDDRGVAVKLN
jgi:hypothetical protein